MWNVTKDVCETEEAGTRETNEKSCRKGYEEEGKRRCNRSRASKRAGIPIQKEARDVNGEGTVI